MTSAVPPEATIHALGPQSLRTLRIPSVTELETLAIDPDALAAQAIVGFKGADLASRPFNLLRAQVVKRALKHGQRLIGITSAAPDAGKSFVAANLAAAFARVPEREVYLFDLDLRRPSIAERYGIELEVGLGDFLQGTTDDLRAIGRRFGDSNLSVYGSKRLGNSVNELLAGTRFEMFIAAVRGLSDTAIVLCDLPPAFVSDDAVNVIERLDGYLHVVEEGVTPQRQVEELRAMMEPAPCLGAVLNRYSGRWNDSYGYAAARKYSRYYDTAD